MKMSIWYLINKFDQMIIIKKVVTGNQETAC